MTMFIKHAILPFLMCFIFLLGCATRPKDVNNENVSFEEVTITESSQNLPVNIETDPVEDLTIVQSEPPQETPLSDPTPPPVLTSAPEITPPQTLSVSKTFLIEDIGYVNRAGIYAYISSQKGFCNENDKDIIDYYFEEAQREGVNRDIAIAQMLHHTNFLRHNDLMRKYNYARFNQPQSWTGFRDEREGVRAHIQHLKHYSNGSLEYPNDNVDPRYSILRSNGYLGKSQAFEELPWAEKVGSSVNTNYLNTVRRHLYGLWEHTDRFS